MYKRNKDDKIDDGKYSNILISFYYDEPKYVNRGTLKNEYESKKKYTFLDTCFDNAMQYDIIAIP